MNIVNYLIPAKLQLTIFQLEGYEIKPFLKWIGNNYLKRNIAFKRELVFTSKVKLIAGMSIVFLFSVLLLAINSKLWFVILLLLIVNPWILFTISILILKPYELYNRQKTINSTNFKIRKLENLNVIGITGSFGKTSTKEILYQILSQKYSVLRTPESYNTVFGVARVVEIELDDSYDYFICEMGAFRKGEIKALAQMVEPKWGILTGITTQHYTKFGSLENTIAAKFELIEAIEDEKKLVCNLDDENIGSELIRRKIKANGFAPISKIEFGDNGSKFAIKLINRTYKVETKLFGLANINNIASASTMALLQGMSANEIIKGIENLEPIDNRLKLEKRGKSVIVNNTYSSNIKAFELLIETAKLCSGSKVLVTPGIVELGKLSKKTHKNLGGQVRDVFDKIVLVGRNSRTHAMAQNIPQNKFSIIDDTREAYSSEVANLVGKYDWIFLENDVTQNY